MNQLNIARFARLNTWLEWQKYHNGIFIRFPQNQLSLHTLYFIHKGVAFKHVVFGMNFSETGVTYPEGINNQSSVYEFLMDQTQPKAVEFTLRNGEKKYLRNQACDSDLRTIRQNISNPNSIYSHLQKYISSQSQSKTSPQQQTQNLSSKINYFLNQFYMRLTAQTYCRIHGLKPTTVIDKKLKNQILNYMGEQYENHSPAAIRKVYNEREIIVNKIEQTKKEIKVIEDEGQRKIKFYKIGAALVTATHIISFTYMIFFVDWLGWDIIEPITYSITVAYTLLGIRFYRKYKTDRTGSSIRQILLKMIMKPHKMVLLKDLKARLALQELQLRRIQSRARLLKNRINFRTSLADAFTQRT